MTHIEKQGKTAVLQATGDIIATGVPELREQMKQLVHEGITELTIDLASTAMIDSVGIGLIVSIHNSLSPKGGKLALINVSKDLQDLFHTMRLDQHFNISGA
jgi:serine/threonine-protein kinase RsbW